MKDRKTLLVRVLTGAIGGLLLLTLVFRFALLPKEPTLTREYTFDLDDPAAYEDLIPERVTENGREYVVDRELTEHEILQALPFYEETVEFEALPTKEAPRKHEVTIDGVKYILELVEADYTEGVREVDVSDTVEFTGYTSAPRVPATAPVSFKSTTGEEITVEGQLESFEQVSGYYWTNTLVIKARVEMPVGAVGYIYQGRVKIPYNEQTPAWQGYEEDILAGEGLDANSNQITGARWTGAAVEKDGIITRLAEFTGRRRVSDWQAVYTAKGEHPAYNAVALYRGNAAELNMPEVHATRTEYKIRAVVHYTLLRVANGGALYRTAALNPAIVNVAIVLLVAGLLLCIIMIALDRRKTAGLQSGMDDETQALFQDTFADALSAGEVEEQRQEYEEQGMQTDD